MNLELSKDKIYNILKRKHKIVDKKVLVSYIKKTYLRTISFLEPLLNKDIEGYERKDKLGYINPLVWELGHVLYFWEYKTLRLLFNLDEFQHCVVDNSEKMFNSHIVSREERFEMRYNLKKIINAYHNTIQYMINKLESKSFELNSTTSYLIMISILHNEMHNESFLFSSQLLNLSKPCLLEIDKTQNYNCITNIEMIDITGFKYQQGIDRDTYNFTFDNEMPSFFTNVDDFKVSKYPITQYQYLQFIKANGYYEKKYWLHQGWQWVKKNNINKPLYWEKIKDKWYVKKFGKLYLLQDNIPVHNISWYEANAYCKWKDVRLPTETEWEFMATNGGTSLYPWGNRKINEEYCNINYKYDGPVRVEKYMTGDNYHRVSQLIGNVWEWCQEPIYPYDGFKIDPVYREMSYPFFGHKRICRGGSWAVSDFLINSKYRNAQMPDCRLQYIGFRVCL
tara:strand:- start:2755 stop:4107 length:1353 start_codon:yes stop_codon:yes gene_type:complete